MDVLYLLAANGNGLHYDINHIAVYKSLDVSFVSYTWH